MLVVELFYRDGRVGNFVFFDGEDGYSIFFIRMVIRVLGR